MKRLLVLMLCLVMVVGTAALARAEAQDGARVLVVYYSLTGTTQKVAALVKDKAGADLYVLEPETPYSQDQELINDEVAAERESGEIRALTGELPDLSGYDLVLIGSPVWNGLPSNPVQKYLGLTDFTGKRVAGFWTAYANAGDYAEAFKGQINGAEALDGLGLLNADVADDAALGAKIDAWLDAIR